MKKESNSIFVSQVTFVTPVERVSVTSYLVISPVFRKEELTSYTLFLHGHRYTDSPCYECTQDDGLFSVL